MNFFDWWKDDKYSTKYVGLFKSDTQLYRASINKEIPYFTMPTKHCETSTQQLLKFVREVQMFDKDLQSERVAEIIDLNNLCIHCAKTLRQLRNKNIDELLEPLDLNFVRRLLKDLNVADDIIVEIFIHAPKDSLNCDSFKIREAFAYENNYNPKGFIEWIY